jgi:hypothetical protein
LLDAESPTSTNSHEVRFRIHPHNFCPKHTDNQWKGFGTEWTFDHRLPVNAFNVCDPDELLALNYFMNIDALTLEQNASKNGTFDPLERDEYLREWREDTAIDVCKPF